MADFEYSLTRLSVDVSSAGSTMTAVINFTQAGKTYKVTLPAVPHDEIRQIFARLGYAISRDQVATRLVGGDAFTVELIR